MRLSFSNIKFRIALHSFASVAVCLILFLLSLYFSDAPTGKYATGGMLTASIVTTIFRRRKYLTSIQTVNDKIVVHYLNQILFQRIIEIDKTDLEILDIKGKNWWFGELDSMILSNKQLSYKFAIINNKVKQKAVKCLEYE